MQQQGIAVTRRSGRHLGAEDAARTAAVVDDDAAARNLGQLGGDDARHNVDCPAGCKRHDDADRLFGIGLGRRFRDAGDREGKSRNQDRAQALAPAAQAQLPRAGQIGTVPLTVTRCISRRNGS
jgi:hypothetical protein